MDNNIRKLLGLQDYTIVALKDGEDEQELGVELTAKACCPHCGQDTRRVHQESKRPSRVLWAFLGQKRLWLVVRRRRMWCEACRKAFTQPLPGVGRRQRVSVLAQVSILQALAEQSFSALSRAWSISYGRMQRILLRLQVPWCGWNELVGDEGPIHLGIDEHSYRGKDLVITLSCLSQHQLLGILEDDRQETLKRALQAIPEEVKGRIVGVCIDGKQGFRSVARKELPGATIVLDHFHLIQDANKRLDETRRLEQSEGKKKLYRWPLLKGQERLTGRQAEQLEQMLKGFPAIKAQHWIKEQLRQLYRCENLGQAQEHLGRILINCENAEDVETVLWGKFLRAWRREILGYFQVRITNAYTEGCHTKVKLLKRLSYGYRNVQVYIRKMMLGFLPRSFQVLAPHLLT